MFKNPLKKYQQGGQMSTEEAENQMAQVLAEAFQMDPQVVKARIQEIRQNPEESKLFAQGLQMLQQGDQQNGMAIIGKLFQVPSRKQGGKIDSFVCRHAKSRHVAGCGCKEDGGKFNETQRKQQGGFLPGDVNNIMVQDTTRRNPDGSVSRIKIIASPNGDAARQTITGRDTTSVGGYWNDNRFIPDGDIVYDNNELENGIKALQQRPYYLGGARKASLDNGRNYLNQNRNVNPYRELENGGVVKGQEGIPGGIRTATGYIAPRTRNINGIDMQLASVSGKGNEFLYTNGADSSFVVHQPYGDRIFTRSNDGTFSGSSNRARDLGDYVLGFDAEGNLDPSTAETMFNRFRNLENGTTVSRHNPTRWTQVQSEGGVVKGRDGLEIPVEAPSTGEIRPDSTTNPIRSWIDRAVDNNSALRTASRYARNFGNSAMGKI